MDNNRGQKLESEKGPSYGCSMCLVEAMRDGDLQRLTCLLARQDVVYLSRLAFKSDTGERTWRPNLAQLVFKPRDVEPIGCRNWRHKMRVVTETAGQLRYEFVTSVHHVALRCTEIDISRVLLDSKNFDSTAGLLGYFDEIRWRELEDMFAGFVYSDRLPVWYLALAANDLQRVEIHRDRGLVDHQTGIFCRPSQFADRENSYWSPLVYILDGNTSPLKTLRLLRDLVDLGADVNYPEFAVTRPRAQHSGQYRVLPFDSDLLQHAMDLRILNFLLQNGLMNFSTSEIPLLFWLFSIFDRTYDNIKIRINNIECFEHVKSFALVLSLGYPESTRRITSPFVDQPGDFPNNTLICTQILQQSAAELQKCCGDSK